MDTVVKDRNRILGEKIVEWIGRRNMEGYFCETAEEAKSLALSLMPKGSSVTWGGSKSIAEIGLTEAVSKGEYVVYDRSKAKSQEEIDDIYRKAYFSDFYLASCNAITEEGILVNIDGNANRVSAMSYGPKNVVLIVGMNKVAKTVDEAVARARNVAAPINVQRFRFDTPCFKTGSCMNCLSPSCICCQFLITRFSRVKNRTKVILVNENLGF